MPNKDYIVSLQQGTSLQLYLPQKSTKGWASTISGAGIFSYKEALKLANKQKERFIELNQRETAPPAGYMHITICEINDTFKILAIQDILLPERIV